LALLDCLPVLLGVFVAESRGAQKVLAKHREHLGHRTDFVGAFHCRQNDVGPSGSEIVHGMDRMRHPSYNTDRNRGRQHHQRPRSDESVAGSIRYLHFHVVDIDAGSDDRLPRLEPGDVGKLLLRLIAAGFWSAIVHVTAAMAPHGIDDVKPRDGDHRNKY
jgi:hypothetical protein